MSDTLTQPRESPRTRGSAPAHAHLSHLDGVRGLAALYVVIFHIRMITLDPVSSHVSHWLRAVTAWAGYGHYAVNVFIVLSGYCLMLPVVRAPDGALQGGAWGFFRRRARRILPPYYAALAVCLVVLAVFPKYAWTASTPAFTTGTLLSHLFLVHNLRPDWIEKIDGPMWSVATEWQIYFLFPLLLLPVWRRWGIPACVAAGFGLVLGWRFGLHHVSEGASPQFIESFVLGMAGAAVGFETQKNSGFNLERVRKLPWGLIYGTSLTLLVAAFLQFNSWMTNHRILIDPVFGIIIMSGLIWLARRDNNRIPPVKALMLRFLSRPLIVGLGAFSYSLYLMHYPCICLFHDVVVGNRFSPGMTLAFMETAGLAISIGVSYLFFLAFERPFLVSRKKKTTADIHLAVPSVGQNTPAGTEAQSV